MIQSWMTQPESVDNILSLFNLSISFSFDEAPIFTIVITVSIHRLWSLYLDSQEGTTIY